MGAGQHSKSQLRHNSKYFNQDLQEDLATGSQSPKGSRYQISGAKIHKSAFLKPFIPSGVVHQPQVSASQSQMKRNNSKLASVRDSMASELSYARNGFYLHRGTNKSSPKDIMKKRGDLLEQFKSHNKPPTIVSLALN